MGTDDLRSTSRRIVKGACPHDCPDTCALETTVENGVAVEVRGGAMPFTDGTLCTKVAKYLDRTYSKDRVLHPLRRVGPKGPGQGRLERIMWDEALPERAQRYPLAFISPPCRNFLNSSFANLPFALASEKEPRLDIHPDDARARGIAEGDKVRVFNDRGAFTVKAAISTRARPGCVVAPSVWWRKLAPDGRNANDVTSQALADLGGAATFYDCLVDVEGC